MLKQVVKTRLQQRMRLVHNDTVASERGLVRGSVAAYKGTMDCLAQIWM